MEEYGNGFIASISFSTLQPENSGLLYLVKTKIPSEGPMRKVSPAAYASSFIYRSTFPESTAELARFRGALCYSALDMAGKFKLTQARRAAA